MADQPLLLQLLQFVGLLTPALAILIELLVQFHGGLSKLQERRKLPAEIQLLFIGFSLMLLGGMIIGIQLGLTFNNGVTQAATLLIFGGVPLLALSVILMNIRLSRDSDLDSGILPDLALGIKYSISIVIPLLLTIFVYFGISIILRQYFNLLPDWWIFHQTADPIWYFYILAAGSVYKVMYSLWSHTTIPTVDYDNVIHDWFIVTFTIAAFLLLFVGPVFGVYTGLLRLNLPYISPTSPLSEFLIYEGYS